MNQKNNTFFSLFDSSDINTDESMNNSSVFLPIKPTLEDPLSCDLKHPDFNLVSSIQNTNTFLPIKNDFDLNSTTLNAFTSINKNPLNPSFQYNPIFKNNNIESNDNNQISNQIPNITTNNDNYINNYDLLNNNILFQNYNDSSPNLLPPFYIANNDTFSESLNINIGNITYKI